MQRRPVAERSKLPRLPPRLRVIAQGLSCKAGLWRDDSSSFQRPCDLQLAAQGMTCKAGLLPESQDSSEVAAVVARPGAIIHGWSHGKFWTSPYGTQHATRGLSCTAGLSLDEPSFVCGRDAQRRPMQGQAVAFASAKYLDNSCERWSVAGVASVQVSLGAVSVLCCCLLISLFNGHRCHFVPSLMPPIKRQTTYPLPK